MIVSPSKVFINIGIFGDALDNVENFNYNIYLAYMLQDSLEKRNKMQARYETALRNRNVDVIEDLQKELELFDKAMALTVTMLNGDDHEN